MTTPKELAGLTRPIIGIENRTAQEVFDIMCGRIEHSTALRRSAPVLSEEEIAGAIRPHLRLVPTSEWDVMDIDGVDEAARAVLTLLTPAETAPHPAGGDGIVERLRDVVERLETADTLPKPGDLHYPVKNPGEGTGWTYRVTGLLVSDLRQVLTEIERLQAQVAGYERSLKLIERVHDQIVHHVHITHGLPKAPGLEHAIEIAASHLTDIVRDARRALKENRDGR